MTVESGSTLLANSVTLNDSPLTLTGEGSWLIYGQSGQTSPVGGDYTLTEDVTIPSGVTVTVLAGSTLDLGGHTLTVEGTLNIANQSGLTGSGTLDGSGTFTLTDPDPVISGGDGLTYDGTDQFDEFSLTAPTGSVTVMGKDFTISGSASLEGWSLDTQEIKNAGTYTVTATNSTSTIEKKVTVKPATISIASATVQDKTYDGRENAAVTSVVFTGLVNDESLTGGADYTAEAKFTGKSAGDKTATVTVTLTNGNYTFGTNSNTTTATASIEPLRVELSWDYDGPFTYDGSQRSVTASIRNTVNGDTISLEYGSTTTAATNAGNYTATVSGLGGTDAANYTLDGVENLTQAWSIASASIADATVELGNSSFTYNGSEQNPAVTVTLGGNTLAANTDYDVTFSGSSTDAGTYTVTVTGKGNYSGTADSKTYTIKPAEVTPSISGTATKAYDGTTNVTTNLSITLGGVVGDDSVTAAVDSYAYDSADAGEGKTVTASGISLGSDDAGNYALSSTTATTTGTITPAALTVTADAKTKTYGDADPELTYQADGLIGGDTLTGALSRATGDNVGEYAITQGTLSNSNYDITFNGATLTVAARPVALEWSDTTSFTYDGTEHSVAATVTNAVNGDTVALTYTDNTATNAGTYTATVSDLTGAAANYTLEGAGSTSQEWSIAPATATVTVKDRNAWVGDAVPTDFGDDDYAVTGLLGDDELSTKPTLRVEESDDLVREGRLVAAGTLTIVADGAQADNYEIGYVYGTLTVVSRPAPTPDPDESETVTNPDGSVTTTVTRPDGSSTATTSTGGGTEAVVERSGSGEVVSVPASVSGADAAAGAVELPVPGGLAAGQQVSVSVPEGGAAVVVPVSGGASPSAVLALVGEGGGLTALPKTASADGGLGVTLASDAVLAVVDDAPSFPDVSGDEWYAAEVAPFVSSRGILTGVVTEGGATEFQGDLGTDRAMFVTMLHRLELEPGSAGASFPDVSGDEWYAAAAAWGDGCGIVSGYGDGTAFGGTDPVTREQMAVFMYRYAQWLGLDTSARAGLDFPDGGSVSSWAKEAMSWAVAEGLFGGDTGTGALRPTDGATRAEAAAVIMRLVNGVLA